MKKLVLRACSLIIMATGSPLWANLKHFFVPSASSIRHACEVFTKGSVGWTTSGAFDSFMNVLNDNIVNTQEFRELTSGAKRNTPIAHRLNEIIQAMGLYISALSKVPSQPNKQGPAWYDNVFLPAYKQLKKVQPSYISLGRVDLVRDIERTLRAFIILMLKAENAAYRIKYGHGA